MQKDSDFRFEIFKASGPGGQKRNKSSSGVKCWHIPTGLKQERTGKCQHQNRKNSKNALIKILNDMVLTSTTKNIADSRRNQIGSGMRGDKRRTYRVRDNSVTDHITGKSCRYIDIMKGAMNKLW